MFWFVFRRGVWSTLPDILFGRRSRRRQKSFRKPLGILAKPRYFSEMFAVTSISHPCPEAFFLRTGKQKSRTPVMKNGFLANQDSTLIKNK